MSVLDDLHIGVLRGGTSNEYHDSLKTGAHILSDLHDRNVSDIFIDKSGDWYIGGIARTPSHILGSFDVVINSLHGGMGEDGSLQRLLFSHHIPHTGSGGLASALSLRKPASKKLFVKAGIRTPRFSIFHPHDPQKDAERFIRTFALPVMIKPAASGGSHGIIHAKSFADIRAVFEGDQGEMLVEEYIYGKMVTCGVVEQYRSQGVYPLIPVEVDHGDDPFYIHEKRGEYGFRCPSGLSSDVKREIQEMARAAHNILDLAQYSQSDFIVTPQGRVYLLEVNALPSLEDDAPFIQALTAVGTDRRQFLDHILELALTSR